MTSRQFKRRHLRNIKNNFSKYFNILNYSCKSFNTEIVPTNLFNELTPKLKIVSETKEQIIINLIDSYNNVIDSLIDTVNNKIEREKSNGIHLYYIKECISIILKSYKEGMAL